MIGIYATGNDFGDNHVFVPLETFRRIYDPGERLSKIRITVDSVANVEAVTEDLKRLPGVDAVTASEQVSTAKTTLGSMAAATLYGSLLLFAIGGVHADDPELPDRAIHPEDGGVRPGLVLVLVVAVLAAVIGSAYGVWQAVRLSPLEAMKHE